MVNPIAISGAACIAKEGSWWQNQGELQKKEMGRSLFINKLMKKLINI
jgi:hypothetical protein